MSTGVDSRECFKQYYRENQDRNMQQFYSMLYWEEICKIDGACLHFLPFSSDTAQYVKLYSPIFLWVQEKRLSDTIVYTKIGI